MDAAQKGKERRMRFMWSPKLPSIKPLKRKVNTTSSLTPSPLPPPTPPSHYHPSDYGRNSK